MRCRYAAGAPVVTLVSPYRPHIISPPNRRPSPPAKGSNEVQWRKGKGVNFQLYLSSVLPFGSFKSYLIPHGVFANWSRPHVSFLIVQAVFRTFRSHVFFSSSQLASSLSETFDLFPVHSFVMFRYPFCDHLGLAVQVSICCLISVLRKYPPFQSPPLSPYLIILLYF